MNSKVSTAKHLLKENMFRYVVTTAPSKGLALVRCARHSTAMTKFGSYMRSVVPEAGVNGRDKLSHPTISVRDQFGWWFHKPNFSWWRHDDNDDIKKHSASLVFVRRTIGILVASLSNYYHTQFIFSLKLEQLERLRSEDTPRRPMITHTIDQFILNPKSIILTSSYRIPSQNRVKAEKLEKLAKNWLFVANMEIIDLELKTLQSGHDFHSQGRMTLKI